MIIYDFKINRLGAKMIENKIYYTPQYVLDYIEKHQYDYLIGNPFYRGYK